MIPGTRGTEGTPLATRPLVYDPTNARLFVSVRNAGRGPALFIRVALDPDNNSPDLWNLGALAPGDEVQLRFSGIHSFDSAKQVLIDYRDLAGRQYASALVLDKVTSNGQDTFRYYDVRLFADQTVTPHGDALPQDGLQPLPGS